MAKTSAKTLKRQYDKFKKDCISTYWEFKHLGKKLKGLCRRAVKIADGIGKLPTDMDDSDPLLFCRLGDFPIFVESALVDIDATLYNIQHSRFDKAISVERKRQPALMLHQPSPGKKTKSAKAHGRRAR